MDMEAVITYNHFMKNRKTTFLTDEDGQKALKDIFQEGFLGPADLDNVKDDFPMQLHDKMPDFKREQACFTWNSETKKQLQFEDCIQVLLFDQKGEIFLENKASGASRAKVIVIRHRDHFEVVQNGTQVATFKDEVSVLKRSYLCYKIIEEDRFELVEGIRFPAEDTYIEEERRSSSSDPSQNSV